MLSPIGFLGRFGKKLLESLGFQRKRRKRYTKMTEPSGKYGVNPLARSNQEVNTPRSPWFIVGIGLNVQQSDAVFATAGLPEATSLAQFAAHPLDTHTIAASLIHQLDRDYEALCQGNLGTLETRWKEHLDLLGKHVVAECYDTSYHGRLIELSFHSVKLAQSDEPTLVLPPNGLCIFAKRTHPSRERKN